MEEDNLPQTGESREDPFSGLTEFAPLTKKAVELLREFQKDCDLDRAIQAAGLNPRYKEEIMNGNSPLGRRMKRELQKISEDFFEAIHLNTNAAARKHLELMQRFEDDYEKAEIDNRNKGALAGTLARMSDTSLKATGHFQSEGVNNGVKVEINIDLGDTNQPIEVDGKIIDESSPELQGKPDSD